MFFKKKSDFNRFPLLYSFRVQKVVYGSSPQICFVGTQCSFIIERFCIQILTYVFS